MYIDIFCQRHYINRKHKLWITIFYQKTSIEFVTVGVEFCALMEKAQETAKNANSQIPPSKILPLLYLKAILLPDSIEENEEYDINIEHFVTEEYL